MKLLTAQTFIGIAIGVALVACFRSEAVQDDKQMHFAGSFAIGVGSRVLVKDPFEAFALAMVPGVIKEFSDSRKGGSGFSGADLLWDALGAGLGVYSTHWAIRSGQIQYRTEF